MRLGVVLVVVVWLGAAGSSAAAQPDAQLRWPSLGPDDLLLVRGTEVVPHLEVAIGLDADLVRRPIVLVDRALGLERALVETRLTTTVTYAVGVADSSQVTLAVPLAWQEGTGREPLSRHAADALPAGAAGDVRLDFVHGLTPECASPERPCFGAALASGLVLPTGDERAFTGAPGLGAYGEAVGEGRLGSFVLRGSWAFRLRQAGEIARVRVASSMPVALAAALSFLEARLLLAAEIRASFWIHSDASAPLITLGEVRAVLGRSRATQVALGVGRGVNDGLGAPELQVILSARYAPREERATPRRP